MAYVYGSAAGWNVSGAVAYSINTENHATNYQSGDSGSGAVLGANMASVRALGPWVSYGTLVGRAAVQLCSL